MESDINILACDDTLLSASITEDGDVHIHIDGDNGDDLGWFETIDAQGRLLN